MLETWDGFCQSRLGVSLELLPLGINPCGVHLTSLYLSRDKSAEPVFEAVVSFGLSNILDSLVVLLECLLVVLWWSRSDKSVVQQLLLQRTFEPIQCRLLKCVNQILSQK